MTDLYEEFKQLEEELRNLRYKPPDEVADRIYEILDEDDSFHAPSPEEEDGEDALCTVCGDVLDGSDDEATIDEIRGPEHGASKVIRRYICSEGCAMEAIEEGVL